MGEDNIGVGDLVVMHNNEYHAHRVFHVERDYQTWVERIIKPNAYIKQAQSRNKGYFKYLVRKLVITQVANITMQEEVDFLKKPQKVFPHQVRKVDLLQLCRVHAELATLINDLVKERSK